MAQISIATCTLGIIRIEHELDMLAQVWPLGHGREYVVLKGYTIQNARNLAVRDAVEHGSDYVLFYDDDMLPRAPDAMMKLISTITQNPEMDVLAAVYPRRTPLPEPVVEKAQGDGTFWGWQDGEIHRCWMVGTGFTIYRIKAFDKLDVPVELVKAADSSEPVECRRVFEINTGTDDYHFAILAKEAGITQYVHGGIICEQIGLDGKRWRVEDALIKV